MTGKSLPRIQPKLPFITQFINLHAMGGNENMANITLVSEKTARKGARFTFLGPADACAQCSLQELCTALRIGGRYEIVEIRGRKHQCSVFHGDAMVVEYRELPLLMAINGEKLIEGAVISYKKEECDHIGCPHFTRCAGKTLPTGTRIKILRIDRSLECAHGMKIMDVEAEFVD